MKALPFLEAAAGIPVMRTLSDYTRHIQNMLGLVQFVTFDLKSLLSVWINKLNVQWIPPTWKNLLLIIRLFNQDEVAQQVETYLSARATEESHMIGAIKESETYNLYNIIMLCPYI